MGQRAPSFIRTITVGCGILPHPAPLRLRFSHSLESSFSVRSWAVPPIGNSLAPHSVGYGVSVTLPRRPRYSVEENYTANYAVPRIQLKNGCQMLTGFEDALHWANGDTLRRVVMTNAFHAGAGIYDIQDAITFAD
jgi:hypothetical protein